MAATGGIEGDGTIDDVGWVAVKAGGAVSAGAQVLLVPATQQSIAYHTTPAAAVYGVKSLSEALEVLQR